LSNIYNRIEHRFYNLYEVLSSVFGYSQKDLAQNILLSKAVQTFNKNSSRFIEGTYLPHSILLNCYHFLLHNWVAQTSIKLKETGWLNELGSCRGPGWLNELGSCRGPVGV
jgi:hypothetical protein